MSLFDTLSPTGQRIFAWAAVTVTVALVAALVAVVIA